MKTIKFISFAFLLSLAWVACKNNGETTSADQSAEATEVAIENQQSTAKQNIAQLKDLLANKISALEASLADASEEAKTQINADIEAFKGFQQDLETMATKVENATEESWQTMEAELQTLYRDIKVKVTGTNPERNADSMTN